MEHKCDKELVIESIHIDVRETRGDVKKILQRVSVLEVKSGMWGFLGGLAAWAIYMIQKKM
jgi:hypothetical protein